MTSNTWAATASRTIATAISQSAAIGMSADETLDLVDRAYPFGERRGTPYKTWLRIRKEKLIAAGIIAAAKTPDHIKNFWS